MRNNLLLIILVLSSIQISYGQFMNGMSRYFKTPNGHIICDEHEVSSCINAPVGELVKWYFYKNRIIGLASSGYFILNEIERQDSLYITRSEIEWITQLERRDLKPVLWTKWYTIDDGSYESKESEFGKHWLFYSSALILLIILIFTEVFSQNSGKILAYVFISLILLRFFIFLSVDWTNSY